MYSVALVASRPTPLITAITKPAAATGTVGLLMAASVTLRQSPNSRRSRTRTAPKSEATPRIWTRFTTPYIHTPDSRIAWPIAEPCSHAMNSYRRSSRLALCTIGIDVERAAVPGYPFRLNLEALGVPIAMTMDRDRSSYWNDAFLQACPLGAGGRSQCEIPDLAIGSANLHARMRSGKANRSYDSACELKFLIQVPTPTVMGRCWRS